MNRRRSAIRAMIDGYDLLAERERSSGLREPTLRGRCSRGAAQLEFAPNPPAESRARVAVAPRAGHFVELSGRICFDASSSDATPCRQNEAHQTPLAASSIEYMVGLASSAFGELYRGRHDANSPPSGSPPAEIAARRLASLTSRFGAPVVDRVASQLSGSARTGSARTGLARRGPGGIFYEVRCQGASGFAATSLVGPRVAVDFDREVASAQQFVEQLLDRRPLDEILDDAGGVAAALAGGRMPIDLVATLGVVGFERDPFLFRKRQFIQEMSELIRASGGYYAAHEEASFARTGAPFVHQHFGVAPDLVALEGPAGGSIYLFRDDLLPFGDEESLVVPSLDGAFLAAVAHCVEGSDPIFLGQPFPANQRIKGEFVRMRLANLAERYEGLLVAFGGIGSLFAVTFVRGSEALAHLWKRGIWFDPSHVHRHGEEVTVQLSFLPDVLTHEIDVLMDALEGVLGELDE